MYFLPLRVLKEHKSTIAPEVLIQCYEVVTQGNLSICLSPSISKYLVIIFF